MKKVLLWVGGILGGIVGVLVLVVLVLFFLGTSRVNKDYDIQVAAVTVPSDEESIERGRHLANSIGLCVECHGDNLAGDILEDDGVFGTLVPTNLTAGRGGIGGTYTDIDFVRAIRHGVGSDGKPLAIMPSNYFYEFNDADLGSIIAYLKSLPPVDNELAETKLGPLGRILTLLEAEILPAQVIDHDAPRPAAVPVGVTREYGEYLAFICSACHGKQLSGGPIPGEGPDAPVAPNLTQLTSAQWQEADFITAMKTGATPFKRLDEEFMPWDQFANLTDDELKAIWLYISSLEPRDFEQ